jgi:hypothetical protein
MITERGRKREEMCCQGEEDGLAAQIEDGDTQSLTESLQPIKRPGQDVSQETSLSQMKNNMIFLESNTGQIRNWQGCHIKMRP